MHVLERPSYSPDLHQIENIWGHMKQELYQKAITDVEEMKLECVKVWDTI